MRDNDTIRTLAFCARTFGFDGIMCVVSPANQTQTYVTLVLNV